MTARDDIAKALHDHGLCVEVDGHRRITPACQSFARALLASPAVARLLNEARTEGWEPPVDTPADTEAWAKANPTPCTATSIQNYTCILQANHDGPHESHVTVIRWPQDGRP